MAIPNDGSVPGSDERSWWLDFGMALHFEADGSAEGLEIFQQWSAEWTGYDSDATEDAWNSTGRTKGNRLTGHFIFARAEQFGWRDLERLFGLFDDIPEQESDDDEEDGIFGLGPTFNGSGL